VATFPEWAVFGSTGILPWDAASIWWWIIIQGVVDSTGMIHRQITATTSSALWRIRRRSLSTARGKP
jgi:hypothetical protein